MEIDTVKKLNSINDRFYKQNAKSFDATRQSAWEGWKKLQGLLTIDRSPWSILDVGCGNGRFLKFLLDKFFKKNRKVKLNYLGIDFSEELLNFAQTEFALPKRYNVRFENIDLTQSNDLKNIEGDFNFIALLAVLHHIPGYKNRIEILKSLCNRVKPGGQFCISFWQYKNSPRLRKLIASPRTAQDILDEVPYDLEEGDHLLDWNRTKVYRYCHNFSDEEISRIKNELKKMNFKIQAEFSADGKEKNLNRYLLISNV